MNHFDWDHSFLTDFDLQTGFSKKAETTKRYLSQMKDMYYDVQAAEKILETEDPLVYEFYELGCPERPGDLAFGTTILYPGQVGDEYYMTKGHFHTILDTGEVYYCLSGHGYMMMESPEGDWEAIELTPGKACYVPKRYAHRSVCVGKPSDGPLVTFFAFRADAGHDYGHGKYETLATSIVGIVLLCVGFGLFWEGANKIYDFYFKGIPLESPGMIALVAALISIVIKELLYHITVWVGRKQNSQVVIANAWHHRSDAFSSIGTALGIGGAILLGDNWRVLDPLAAVIVSLFIVKVALQLVIPAINDLLEKSLPKEVEDEILAIISEVPEVKSPHNLRTRRIGNNFAIEAHIRVDGQITVTRAHDLTKEIEQNLRDKFGQATHIALHVEPIK